MEVRFASKDDLNNIVILEKECFLFPYKDKDILYELNENPFSHTLVFENNGEIIGYLIYLITFDSASIVRIGVKKSERNKNIATNLLQKCEEHLKKEKVELFTLEVRESNVAAIKLYEKFGFSKICLKKSYYENGENAIYMMKGVF
ncbi:MAG: ribosomal protein S18-alanine N-acetyltransferase [Mollicutes bacterium]|nr:ribosomal protein S18-alanine N-acetyltransferase [Mollicutes bacterium]